MGQKKEKQKEKPYSDTYKVSVFGIFRYATCLEATATLFGVFFGLISGGGLCYNLVLFGDITTSLVERTVNSGERTSYLGLIAPFGGGGRLVNATYEESMDALIADAGAMTASMTMSIGLGIICCVLSVALINWSALRQITRIRTIFLKAILRQDMAWFDTDSEFNLASKMSEDLMKLKEGLGDKLAVVSNLIGTAIICIAESIPLGWELTLACCTVVPFSIAASLLLSNYQTKSSIREMESYSQAGKQAEEVLKSVRTIVAFGGEQKEIDRYMSLLEPAEINGRKRGLYTGIGTGFNWVLSYSLNAIGLTFGTRLVIWDMDKPVDEKRYVVGAVFSVLFCVYIATQSITMCIPHAESFASASAAATSIFKLLDREPTIDSMNPNGLSPKKVTGDIQFEDVHFSYPSRPEVEILKGLTLHIKRGENVALVGSSGCGKSTILQLLQRLYDPISGSVKLDGRDLKGLNVRWLRTSLGVVGQEPVLFKGSIRDNIAIGCDGASDEDIKNAAELAFAHDFIKKLANGYDTVIGERGASLSGGQKQRIAIARSILREPVVLLLDEATSALDPQSEREVQAALDRASVGRTTISVSHRLSAIMNADRIICMDQGTVVEQGTHQDLMSAKGFYYKLITSGQDVPEVIDSVPEEGGDGTTTTEDEQSVAPRHDTKRSTRRVHRRQSARRDSHEWMTPRGSISSVVSTGLQSFNISEPDIETDEVNDEEDKEIKLLSDWQLLSLNRPEWPYIVVGSISAFLQGACFPVFALLYGLTSGIFVYEDRTQITLFADLYSGMFIVVAAVAGVTMCLQSYMFTNAGLKMTSRLRRNYFSALLRQEIGFYDRENNTVGTLCARLSGDAAEVQGATGMRIGLILQGFSSVFVGFIMAMAFYWKLTLMATSFLPLMVGSIWLEGRLSQKSQSDERKAMEAATSIATEAVVSIRTVQSLGIEKIFLTKFEAALQDAKAAVVKKSRFRGLVLGLGIYVPFLSYISATAYGATLVAREGLDYKTVFLVNESVMFGAYMLGQSLVYAPNLNSARACGSRIMALVNRDPAVKTEPNLKDRKDWAATGNFSIKNVDFSYPTRPNQQVLRGFNLKVEAGKTVALVGPSGCGKSTVLQLFQRFYDPDSGNIELDGRDIRANLTLPKLRRQLGVVQQEPVLFDRTLADNIAYGDNSRKVTMDEIIAAAKAANIHNFVVSLPQGYETNLGASGAQLSGGQKQRVCIARALIRSPRLLLLDEATSALDATSERVVTEALEKAAKGRTCITIAHRLSTIKDADVICVCDKGKIIEKGTHSELLNLKGHYWRMSKGQHVA